MYSFAISFAKLQFFDSIASAIYESSKMGLLAAFPENSPKLLPIEAHAEVPPRPEPTTMIVEGLPVELQGPILEIPVFTSGSIFELGIFL